MVVVAIHWIHLPQLTYVSATSPVYLLQCIVAWIPTLLAFSLQA
jgi:hypothetical protein